MYYISAYFFLEWVNECSPNIVEKKTYINYINKLAFNKRKYQKKQKKPRKKFHSADDDFQDENSEDENIDDEDDNIDDEDENVDDGDETNFAEYGRFLDKF